ncbi:MAG: RelA/SpoT family protein [Rikenellaceae bacterium]
MKYRIFLEHCKANYSAEEYQQILYAMRRASGAEGKAVRYDGAPMFYHAFGSADIVAREMRLGVSAVMATLLHEAARTGKITAPEIENEFGTVVLKILKGMNSISGVDAKTSTLQADNFRELIVSYSTDPRVLLIKIADRLEVMRSLRSFPEMKRNKKAWETIHIYAPLAHKLGLYNIKTELEDLALSCLEPKDYRHIAQKLQDSSKEREAYIALFTAPLRERLDAYGYKYSVKGRTKSVYSIWKKMKKQKVPFEGVFDVFAIRIILDCPVEEEKMQCWTTFSVVTDFYTPSPSRMRDWISIPKSNGYESLHSTVLDSLNSEEARWVEVQIRTYRMDETAERGVAAHWRYKEQAQGAASTEEWLERLRSIVDNSAADMSSGDEFDFSVGSSEIFVFTPTGDLRKLPEGATVLDYAFDIHSNLGATCLGATVNGRAVSIKEKLKSGDIVSIKSAKMPRAKVAWLNYVVTNKAKNKIRQILREELSSSANLGKEELERKIKNWRINITLEEAVTVLCKKHKVKTGLEVYDMIAEGRIPLAEVKELLVQFVTEGIPTQDPKARKATTATTHKKESKDTLFIDKGASGIDYRMANCCTPIMGDDIFGFVTINSGITIHRTDCPNARRLKEQYPYRVVEAKWREDKTGGAFLVRIRVEGSDSQGLSADISDALTRKLSLNVRNISLSSFGGAFRGEIAVEVTGTQAVEMIIYHLRKIKAIEKVSRIK